MAGCSNHGCWIEDKKGVGTNGMCHCLEPLEKKDQIALMNRINLIRRTIKAQQRIIIAYRTGHMSLPETVFKTLDEARKAGLIE